MTQEKRLAKTENTFAALETRFPPKKYNLLAPKAHMPGGLPEGTRLVITEIKIDPDTEKGEVFWLPGDKLLVGKVGLSRIANAAGVSWIDEQRKDPRTHPHYVEAFVRGRFTDFDGTVREITGSKTIDLRADAGAGESGKDYAEICTKAKSAKRPRDPAKQIMEARKFIAEIAFAKAKNRAISDGLGMARSHTAEQLSRPFVVPKLALDTSHAGARELAIANAAGAAALLYGSKAQAPDIVQEAEFTDKPAQAGPGIATPVGEEAEGDHPAPSVSDTEPLHDDATGEVLSPLDSMRRSYDKYLAIQGPDGPFDLAGFKLLFVRIVGRDDSDGLTDHEATTLAGAVNALAKKQKELPF